jgi:hypothetical protein
LTYLFQGKHVEQCIHFVVFGLPEKVANIDSFRILPMGERLAGSLLVVHAADCIY